MRFVFTLVFGLPVFQVMAQQPSALPIGSFAPQLDGVDNYGEMFSLQNALKKGPVVVVFYRGQWCPFCNRHMSAIQDSLALLTDLGATVVAITPEQPEQIEKSVKKSDASFSILYDENHKIMDDWKVTFRLANKTHKKYKLVGINIDKASGNEDQVLPVPATYIIAQDGTVVGLHFDPVYKHRMPVTDMVRVLSALK